MSLHAALAQLGIEFTDSELDGLLRDYVGPEPPLDILDDYWRKVWKVMIGRNARLRGAAWCYLDGGPIPGVPEVDRRAYAADPTSNADRGEPDDAAMVRHMVALDPTWGSTPHTEAWRMRRRVEGA